jgi:HEPN domain-containing protein
MPPKDSLYPQQWFRLAAKDLKRAEQLLNLDDPEGCGYHLQQAVEKYLKGYLLSKGWKLKRNHDLEVVLNDTLKYEPKNNTEPSVKKSADTTLSIDILWHRWRRSQKRKFKNR